MVRYVVISMLLGWHVVSFLQQRPEAAREMIDRIISELGKINKNNTCRPKIIVVYGKLYNDDEDFCKIPFKLRRTIAWNYYYLMAETPTTISQAVDRRVRIIVKKSIQQLLNNIFIEGSTATKARTINPGAVIKKWS
jgi:hypothetical protein